MCHVEEALAEFRNHHPNAISHIKRLGADIGPSDLVPSAISTPLSSLLHTHSMTTHGEDIVLEEGEIVQEGQDEQAVPLPIPPCTTSPLPTIPLLSILEWIEGNGPRQEVIMAALMRIRNTTFNHTFSENAANIDRVMVLGCQLVAKTSPGENHTNSIILELGCIQPPGTHPPTISSTTNTGSMATTATTAVREDKWSGESMASQSDTSQWCGTRG